MRLVAVFVALFMTACGSLATPADSTMSRAYIAGLRPEVVSGTVLRIYDGGAMDKSGEQLIPISALSTRGAFYELDVSQIGLGGRDAGGLENGHFYLYVLQSKETAEVGVIASRSIIYGTVTLPAGEWWIRKLPFGLPYREAWGGFPPVHVDGWPQPTIYFTDQEYGNPSWAMLVNGSASDWTLVDASPWIPDNARLAHLWLQVRDSGTGVAGSCYVRSYWGQGRGILVGSTNPWAPSATLTLALRVDSNRKFEYRCTSGSKLWVQVRGYSMTEPS